MRNLSMWPVSLQTIQGPWKTFEGWWISDRWFLPDSPLSSCPSCTGQEYPTRQLVEQLSCWLSSDLTTSLGECGLQTCIRGFQVELIRRSVHILAESKWNRAKRGAKLAVPRIKNANWSWVLFDASKLKSLSVFRRGHTAGPARCIPEPYSSSSCEEVHKLGS